MRELVRRAARRSYRLTKWRAQRRMARRPEPPVIVFSMGKTASTAVSRALQDVLAVPVYQVHHLVPESIGAAEASYRRTDRSARPAHVWASEHLAAHPPTPRHPWRIVTITREPIARVVSEFFQSGRRLGHLDDDGAAPRDLHRFASRRLARTIDWYDAEFAPATGIDVYEHPFDPRRGHALVETPSVAVLVLRQESLGVAPRALAEFLDLHDEPPVASRNVGADKPYADQYRTVTGDLDFSEAVLDRVYASRYVRHFYDDDEIARFRERWGRALSRPDGGATSGR